MYDVWHLWPKKLQDTFKATLDSLIIDISYHTLLITLDLKIYFYYCELELY